MLTGRVWKRLNPFKHKQQVSMLDELLNGSRRISKDALPLISEGSPMMF